MDGRKLTVKCLVVTLAVVIIPAGVLLAGQGASGVLVTVDGHPLFTEGEAYIVNDRTVAPLRPLAEALGGRVDWDGDSRSISITTQTAVTANRIALLESALLPDSAREVVEKWAYGVKMRNGALQFAMLSPMMRAAYEPKFEGLGWVTGTSSPWVSEYEIGEMREVTPEPQAGPGETGEPEGPEQAPVYQVEVAFHMVTSTGPAGTYRYTLNIEKVSDERSGDRWAITDIDRTDIPNAPEDVPVPGIGISLELPGDWQVVSEQLTGEWSVLDAEGGAVGGISELGGLFIPNHSRIVWSREIPTQTGNWMVYLLARSEPAASGIQGEWAEVHAFRQQDDGTYLDFWLREEGTLDIETLVLEAILGSK
ncbi:MAG TPA: copper amine oxidase N-terminal domain-containing protein [Firmicutes bacterium]|nr:copper amine oxidase N-terminal domain-containing protein [Candidatus Fermentithermobacillaceae bacterium]